MSLRLSSIIKLVFVFTALSVRADYWVDVTNGSDSNPGTLASPFLTLTNAQVHREGVGVNTNVNIFLRKGDYFNTTILLVGPNAGAGHDDSMTTWAGYDGPGTVRVWGGEPLTNWAASSNGWWSAPLPAFPSAVLNSSVTTPQFQPNWATNWMIRGLYVDGVMPTRAVYPTNQLTNIEGNALVYTNLQSASVYAPVGFANSQIPATMIAANAELEIDASYQSACTMVSNISFSGSTALFTLSNLWNTSGPAFPLPNNGQSVGFQYILNIQTARVWNTWEGMYGPGSWYWDKINQLVYYYPTNGLNPNGSLIVVPTTPRIFYIQNTFGTGCHDLVFSNISFLVSAAAVNYDGNFGSDLDDEAEISCSYHSAAANIHVVNCTGGWTAGAFFCSEWGYNTNALFNSNHVAYCGASGITSRQAPAIITNNFFHDTGQIVHFASAVRANTNSTIIQNTFSNLNMSAHSDYQVNGQIFRLNYIFDAMKTHEDEGAWYQFQKQGNSSPTSYSITTNIVDSNIWQNVGVVSNAFPTSTNAGQPQNLFRPAIYSDEQSSNVIVQFNIFKNCPKPTFANINIANIQYNSNVIVNDVLTPSGYTNLEIYAAGSTGLIFVGNVGYTTGNISVNDQGAFSGTSPNYLYSTAGNQPSLPSFITQNNPMFTSLTPPLAYAGIAGVPINTLIVETNYNGVGPYLPSTPFAVIGLGNIGKAVIGK